MQKESFSYVSQALIIDTQEKKKSEIKFIWDVILKLKSYKSLLVHIEEGGFFKTLLKIRIVHN